MTHHMPFLELGDRARPRLEELLHDKVTVSNQVVRMLLALAGVRVEAFCLGAFRGQQAPSSKRTAERLPVQHHLRALRRGFTAVFCPCDDTGAAAPVPERVRLIMAPFEEINTKLDEYAWLYRAFSTGSRAE